jgi:HK97 family phage prohead protease
MNNLHIENSYEVELVRRDDKEYLEGYAILFYDGTETTEYIRGNHRERIAPTALDRTPLDNVSALLNHNEEFWLGDTQSGSVELLRDRTGLLVRIPVVDDPDIARAKAKILRGKIKGLSFKGQGRTQTIIRGTQQVDTITEIKSIEEVSFVYKPAYKGTGKRLLVREELNEATKERIERAKKMK